MCVKDRSINKISGTLNWAYKNLISRYRRKWNKQAKELCGRKWGILSKGKKSKTNKQTNTKQKQKILGRTWEPGFWQGLKQAVSNTIILKGETITTCPFAVYAFTNRAFQRIRPPESCPLDKMCSRAASDKLQRETNRCDYGPWHLARTLTVS